MRKRVFTVLAAAVLLASCGAESGTETKAQMEGMQIPVAVETETTAQTQKEPEPAEPEPEAPQEWDLLLVDEAGVRITAKGFDEGGYFGPELKLLIENNTEKNLTVQCRGASVNGYMTGVSMSAEVASKKKANDGIVFYESDLDACGISVIADMEFSFHIFTEDYDTYLDTEPIQVTTSAADKYRYRFDDSGKVLYDGDGFKAVLKGISGEGSIFGPGILLYLENNGDVPITVQARDVSLNGFMIDPIFSSEIMPEKKAIDQMTFMESDLEENGISGFEETEFSFYVYTDGYGTIVDTDPIYINFFFINK